MDALPARGASWSLGCGVLAAFGAVFLLAAATLSSARQVLKGRGHERDYV